MGDVVVGLGFVVVFGGRGVVGIVCWGGGPVGVGVVGGEGGVLGGVPVDGRRW